MYSNEEKKAIEHLKNYPINWELTYEVNQMAIKTILNLIKKQDKIIEKLKNEMNRDDLSYIETRYVLDILDGKEV